MKCLTWSRGSISAASLFCLLWLSMPAYGASPLHWTLGDPECELPVGAQISCGDYGTFYVHTDGNEGPKCEGGLSGVDDPKAYPHPVETPELDPVPYPVEGARVGERRGARLSDGTPWIALVDFDAGNHAEAVQWIVEEMALDTVTTEIFPVDEASLLAELGPSPGDFHLLAALCSIADRSAGQDGSSPPLVVNMSLGRLAGQEDRGGISECEPSTLVCQVAWVIDHLRELGSHFVGAAGNHRKQLFPATLDSVISVGGSALTQLLYAQTTLPAWESPEVKGHFPSNGLCLRGGAAMPAGSSFAAAIYSGWVALVVDRYPGLDPAALVDWAPMWLDSRQCYGLGSGGVPQWGCNATFTSFMEALSGGDGNCWGPETSDTTIVSYAEPESALPPYDSFDDYAAIQPTPEGDPCIPCLGGPSDGLQTGDDLVINMSKSLPVPAGRHMRLAYLRVGSDYYPLVLNESALDEIETADTDLLLLQGWRPHIDFHESASLYFVLSSDPNADCELSPASCFWTSSQVTWEAALLQDGGEWASR